MIFGYLCQSLILPSLLLPFSLTLTALLTSQYFAFKVLSFAIQEAKAIRQIFFFSFLNMNFLKIFYIRTLQCMPEQEQNLVRYFNLKNPRTKNIPSLSKKSRALF